MVEKYGNSWRIEHVYLVITDLSSVGGFDWSVIIPI